ncbi:MAG: 3-dehydroquinate synthase [Anaerovoracaceae bacterium]
METIKISTETQKYKVYLNDGINYAIKTLEFVQKCKVLILTDNNVADLFLREVKDEFDLNGFWTFDYIIEAGEASKSINEVEKITDFLQEKEFGRNDIILALGGGIVGDLTGFIASIYKRGMNFINCPTTLLAMVDSSIGGKNGVNTKFGKNMLGTFYQPIAVFSDTSKLRTLPEGKYLEGMAEIIKVAILGDFFLFEKLEKIADSVLNNIKYSKATYDEEMKIIKKAVKIKANYIFLDEKDIKERQLLNFGHTVGHAIEILSEHNISHGEAVSIGMVAETRIAEKNKICVQGTSERVCNLLKKFNLPTETDISSDRIAEIILNDKKRIDDYVNFALPKDIGFSKLKKVKVSELYL